MNAQRILDRAAAERAFAATIAAQRVRDCVRPLLRRRIRAAAYSMKLTEGKTR